MNENIARGIFRAMAFLGKSFGRSFHRIHNYVARCAYKSPEFAWYRDLWGNELCLSPYYWLDREICVTGTYHAPLGLLIENKVQPGMVCFDIGANIGHIALHLARKVGSTGKVYAFEPVLELARRMKQNVSRNNLAGIVSIQEIALSNKNGTSMMGCADLLKENQGMGSLVNRENEVITVQEVCVQTFDSFVQEANPSIDRIDFIKVDIQGAEILFLQGAKKTLSRYSPNICIEISPSDLLCVDKSPADLLETLSHLRYKVYEIKKDGSLGVEIVADRVTSFFARDNVFCTKQT